MRVRLIAPTVFVLLSTICSSTLFAAREIKHTAAVPNYAQQIAPILRARCEGCHRTGEVAPFTLQNYDQAKKWASSLKRVTLSGYMPPWKPAPGYGSLKEEHRLLMPKSEVDLLAKWVDIGSPAGDLKLAPKPAKYSPGWSLGKPDMILQPTKAYQLSAEGDDVYRHFVVDPHFNEDTWVRGVECHAGNRAVVHHVINYIDASSESVKLDQNNKDGQPGYSSFGSPGFQPAGMLGGWAPGNAPWTTPDGIALKVPKGSKIVIEVHYHKNGKVETDLTKVGLYFARTQVEKELHTGMAVNFWFNIPPGAKHYKAVAESPVRADSHVLAVLPHMHYLGKEIKVWATKPDGLDVPMVWIKNWDFNWQMAYPFTEPIALPRGSKIHLEAYFDNSADNPRHPTPKKLKAVTFGEQTTDEMCLAFVTFTRDKEHLKITPSVPVVTTVRK